MSIDYRLSIHGLAAPPAPTFALVRYGQGRRAEAGRINAEHFDVNRRVASIEGRFGACLVAARIARLASRQNVLQACHDAMSLGALRSIVDQPVALQPLLQHWLAWRRTSCTSSSWRPQASQTRRSPAGWASPLKP